MTNAIAAALAMSSQILAGHTQWASALKPGATQNFPVRLPPQS
jgi:hypothetical protein